VSALQAGLTGPEAAQWLASARIDPDESERADLRHALLLDLLLRLLWRGKKGQSLPAGVNDFLAALPWRDEHQPRRPQTQAELQQKINAVMTMLGGKKVKRGR
jgi:hypothetical protein